MQLRTVTITKATKNPIAVVDKSKPAIAVVVVVIERASVEGRTVELTTLEMLFVVVVVKMSNMEFVETFRVVVVVVVVVVVSGRPGLSTRIGVSS